MKITIPAQKLSDAIATACCAVATKPAVPILRNLLINADEENQKLLLCGFNLSLGIQTRIDATVESGGTLALPAALLRETIQNLGGDLNLEIKDKACTISHSSGKCRIQGTSAEEFPNLPTAEGSQIKISAKKLKAAIAATLFATSKNETKLVLTGVNFIFDNSEWRLAATDGHRLAFASIPSTEENENNTNLAITFPYLNLGELERILEKSPDNGTCEIQVSDNIIQVFVGETKITSRLLEGTYPSYPSLIPTQFTYELYVDKKVLESALRRVQILAEKKDKIVQIVWDVGEETATLYAQAQDVGDAVESISIKSKSQTNENITISFNIDYLSQAIKHITTDEILIRANRCSTPVILCPVGGLLDQLSLVMPVQIRDTAQTSPKAKDKDKNGVDETTGQIESPKGETSQNTAKRRRDKQVKENEPAIPA
ncbi:hypothetical protein WA1_50390 [Scytonema hofmannii PCC 7110]|uniref:DNA polymerase III subunit beta n=1 Tax=Scytonema hofmannii PCC 7110 TaxID=128403 RepID=A0A139WR70_9CYAN|nr:DNA polymerase III subunit beta [Scytonema hofmannii]KYC34935.1 hypothetical protein WA1_50390 [Scytonema hofmannii PCC 7110]